MNIFGNPVLPVGRFSRQIGLVLETFGGEILRFGGWLVFGLVLNDMCVPLSCVCDWLLRTAVTCQRAQVTLIIIFIAAHSISAMALTMLSYSWCDQKGFSNFKWLSFKTIDSSMHNTTTIILPHRIDRKIRCMLHASV